MPIQRTVIDTTSVLQGREAATSGSEVDPEEYASAVTSYISHCVSDVTSTTTFSVHPSQKPWMQSLDAF